MTDPTPTRCRFQFSLRTLLVVVTLFAIPCGWLAVKMRRLERQREAVAGIEKLGGSVSYDGLLLTGEPPGPVWLQKLLGRDLFITVGGVRLDKTKLTDAEIENLTKLLRLHSLNLGQTNVTDAGLMHLKGLTRLQALVLTDTKVTDAGLESLKKLDQLEELTLRQMRITDAGLENLTELKRLQILDLGDTEVTDAGVKKLQQALPNCTIIR